MQIWRFISAMALVALVTMISGHGAAQKQRDDARKYGAMLMAWSGARDAIIKDLVETWEKCEDEINRDSKTKFQCDVYDEKVRQTPIEKLTRAVVVRLPKEDLEDLKRDIVSAASAGYAHGKEKGSAK